MRFATRHEAFRPEIEAAGGECWIGDPDASGTLRYALENVTSCCGCSAGVDAEALHGSRLRMMLEKTTDTTVRGVVYEVGTDAGRRPRWSTHGPTNEIPFTLLRADRARHRRLGHGCARGDRRRARPSAVTCSLTAAPPGCRSSRSPSIRAVAPQTRWSPTT